MAHLQFTLFILLLIAAGSSGKVEAKVSAVIVFGDSTVDAGNNNHIRTLVKSNFEPYGRDFYGGQPTGRFSNGRIATDFISEAFGLKPIIPAYLDPNFSIKEFATGVTFASAGTGLDNVTSDIVSVIPLWKETEMFKEYQKKLTAYLGEKTATETIGEALYFISIGSNDFIENYLSSPRRSSQFTIEEYQDFLIKIMENFILEIYQLGARKITVSGLPPIGCLPLIKTVNLISDDSCKDEFNELSMDFNRKIKGLLVKLKNQVPGIRLVFSNIYYTAINVIRNPNLFGFENAIQGCCGSGRFEISYLCHKSSLLTCTDANKYAFWDAVHPTEKFNLIVADNLMKTSLREFV